MPEICRRKTGTLIAPPLQKARVQQISDLFLKRPTVKGSKKEMSIDNRMRCLQDLKSTGFQTCGGFMVGRPHQAPQVFVNSKTGEVQELLLQSRCKNEK